MLLLNISDGPFPILDFTDPWQKNQIHELKNERPTKRNSPTNVNSIPQQNV